MFWKEPCAHTSGEPVEKARRIQFWRPIYTLSKKRPAYSGKSPVHIPRASRWRKRGESNFGALYIHYLKRDLHILERALYTYLGRAGGDGADN